MISQFLFNLPIYLLLIPILNFEIVHADIAKPGCKSTCGDVMIPYPFGIGANCSLDHWYQIECKTSPNSNSSTKPFLSPFNIEVIDITLKGYESSLRVSLPPLKVCSTDSYQELNATDLVGSPYNYSTQDNVFVMEGCPGSVVLVNQSNEIMAGCGTVCRSNNSAIPTENCYGVRCCQTPLPSDIYSSYSPLQSYKVIFNDESTSKGRNCLVATLVESGSVARYVGNKSNSALVVLKWSMPSRSFDKISSNAYCQSNGVMTMCFCSNGYYGNPYIANGCQVGQECKGCRGHCYGSWDLEGRLVSNDFVCDKRPILGLAAILGLAISFGIVVKTIGNYGLYRFVKRRREMKRRAKFFKHNGGLLLQQQLSSSESVVERTKIFSIVELDKATDHFNENRILGQGGQGTVYKGMLIDGSIVAIKKAKLLDESQLEQFINEVVILSQINHINVVKLLGCSLETEVPLLVYEFVPNGTLFKHIHDPDEDFVISWEMCLKIAAESASAVSYLHSFASNPVYLRDIKTSNILLDEKHRAKVSDFGSSKTLAIDQTHITTLVQGTMGYLDPEYFQSFQFTEKSDVYSFGVVLLELLTRKKPIYRDASSMEQKNLVTEFSFMMQKCMVYDILDPKTVSEAKEEELMSVIELARRCISLSGKMRPTMKEGAMTLEMIIKSPAQLVPFHPAHSSPKTSSAAQQISPRLRLALHLPPPPSTCPPFYPAVSNVDARGLYFDSCWCLPSPLSIPAWWCCSSISKCVLSSKTNSHFSPSGSVA